MRILVAYDGSPASEVALDEVARRPWPAGTHVRLVTVIERPAVMSPAHGEVYAPLVERYRATLRGMAYERVQTALKKLASRPEIVTSYEIRDGSAKHGLLEAVREWRADLTRKPCGGRGCPIPGTAKLARLDGTSYSPTRDETGSRPEAPPPDP